MKSPKIIYFIQRPVPTPEQREEAASLGVSTITFRNASFIGPQETCEKCDGVIGHVPATYKHLPSAQEAIAAWKAGMKPKPVAAPTATAAVSAPPAPVVPPVTAPAPAPVAVPEALTTPIPGSVPPVTTGAAPVVPPLPPVG